VGTDHKGPSHLHTALGPLGFDLGGKVVRVESARRYGRPSRRAGVIPWEGLGSWVDTTNNPADPDQGPYPPVTDGCSRYLVRLDDFPELRLEMA